MRTAGAVYRKLKEAKFRRLIILYKKLSKRIPENCRYNYPYRFLGSNNDSHEIRLCLIHQNDIDLENGIFPHLVDVCQEEEDCLNCNGFIPRYSREEIKKIFEEELNTKNIKEQKYPEVCALEWVLERYAVGMPPASWIQIAFFKIKHAVLGNKIV